MIQKCKPAAAQRGFAFIAALMVMLVLATLIVGVLAMAVSARNLATSRNEYAEAIYVAESGVNKLVSQWHKTGAAPAQPYTGTITNHGANGSYSVTWNFWQPYGPGGFTRYDVIVLTSVGTINTGLPGTIYNLTRTIQVNLDTNGDWAWSHVYTTNDTDPQYQVPPYANIGGASGTITPSDYLDEHGPGASPKLPTPQWDQWLITARAQDSLPYGSTYTKNGPFYAVANRHVYWYDPSASAHQGTGHTHGTNWYVPDPYFPSSSYPDAYVCQSTSKKNFEIIIDCSGSNPVAFSGVYYVNGDVTIKGGQSSVGDLTVTGTIVATGSIRMQGKVKVSIEPLIVNAQDCAARTVYPALVAGWDIEIGDQSTFHTTGVVWAGHSFTAKAADQAGCVVVGGIGPTNDGIADLTLSGNFGVSYGFDTSNPSCPRYEPGSSPPPMFNEPDMGAIQPVPHSYREL